MLREELIDSRDFLSPLTFSLIYRPPAKFMQEQIAACFSGGVAKAEIARAPSGTGAKPVISTAVYETEDGEATLTWSNASFGLSLLVDLRFEEETLSFRLRPWLLWKKRGTKRFRCLRQDRKQLVVEFAWDLRKARFLSAGDPQPDAGYYVTISAGNMFFAAGDMEEEAFRKAKKSRTRTFLVSRREHVVFSEFRNAYRTRARIGGEEKEISLDIRGGDQADARICVKIDRKTVLRVDQLDWKFRGSERIELMGGAAVIHISWDVFRWLFESNSGSSGAEKFSPSELGHAVFVFTIEGEKSEEEEEGGARKVGRRFGLRKIESRSSSSSSSGRSSSIMEWASGEEDEAPEIDGLSLLVSIWRS